MTILSCYLFCWLGCMCLLPLLACLRSLSLPRPLVSKPTNLHAYHPPTTLLFHSWLCLQLSSVPCLHQNEISLIKRENIQVALRCLHCILQMKWTWEVDLTANFLFMKRNYNTSAITGPVGCSLKLNSPRKKWTLLCLLLLVVHIVQYILLVKSCQNLTLSTFMINNMVVGDDLSGWRVSLVQIFKSFSLLLHRAFKCEATHGLSLAFERSQHYSYVFIIGKIITLSWSKYVNYIYNKLILFVIVDN